MSAIAVICITVMLLAKIEAPLLWCKLICDTISIVRLAKSKRFSPCSCPSPLPCVLC